jgi:hypothetical protein
MLYNFKKINGYTECERLAAAARGRRRATKPCVKSGVNCSAQVVEVSMSAGLQGARATAEAQQLPHEVLTGQQAMQRFPGIYAWWCCFLSPG